MRCPPSESRVTHTCCLAVLTGAPTTPVTSPVVPAGPGLSPLQGAECVPFLVRPWPILGFSHWQWQRQLPWKEQEAGQADAAIAVRQEPFQGPGEPWTGQGSGDHAASQPLAEISPRVCENWLPTPWDAAQNTNVFPTLGPRCGGTQHRSLPGPSVEESRERVESPALLHMVWTGWETVSGAKLKPRYSLYGRKNKAGGRNRFDCQSGRLGTEEEVVGGLGFSWGPAPGSEADDLITPKFNGCTGLPSSPRAGVNQAEGTSPTPTWRWNFLNIILFVLIQPLVCVPITDTVFMWSAPNTEIHM